MTTTTINQQAQTLQAQFENFQQDLLTSVAGCTDEDWGKVTAAEQWPVGVLTRHIGAAHYPIIELAELIVTGQPLPEITWDMINQGNAQHATEHANCTRSEVLHFLKEQGEKVSNYLAGLTDDELNRRAYVGLFEAELRAYDLIEQVVVVIAQGHLESARHPIIS